MVQALTTLVVEIVVEPNKNSPEWKTCVRKEKRKIQTALAIRASQLLAIFVLLAMVICGIIYGSPHVVDWWKSLVLPWWLYPSIGAAIIIIGVLLAIDFVIGNLAEGACQERYEQNKKEEEEKQKEKQDETIKIEVERPTKKPVE
jgi:TRAP-type C4-dicarboxylate transport system permease small subunit